MISIVLTNRNRDLRIVKKCLDSLLNQSDKEFDLYLVDYGSNEEYLSQLQKELDNWSNIKFISCPVSGQLWNKSRAINIVLKKINTEFFFVGDIDMIYHPHFIKKIKEIAEKEEIVYFKVGFLSKEESEFNKSFHNYVVAFYSSKEATGMTLYPTQILKEINGYDEFYHGWGAEDTDVHLRIKTHGKNVFFFEKEILMLHQWHPKVYRSKNSKEPFHSKLESINHKYIQLSTNNKVVKINRNFEFGMLPDNESYESLNENKSVIKVTNEKNEVDAFLDGAMYNLEGIYEIKFIIHPQYLSFKNKLKTILGKKAFQFYSLDDINDMTLMKIITNFRNNPYIFVYQKNTEEITLKIKF